MLKIKLIISYQSSVSEQWKNIKRNQTCLESLRKSLPLTSVVFNHKQLRKRWAILKKNIFCTHDLVQILWRNSWPFCLTLYIFFYPNFIGVDSPSSHFHRSSDSPIFDIWHIFIEMTFNILFKYIRSWKFCEKLLGIKCN
jgi:hypothetical protein